MSETKEVDSKALNDAISKLYEFLSEHHKPEPDFLGRSFSREAMGIYARFWILAWGQSGDRDAYEKAVAEGDKARWERLEKAVAEAKAAYLKEQEGKA